MGDHTIRQRSWAAEDCPRCRSDVFVETARTDHDWHCHLCGISFTRHTA